MKTKALKRFLSKVVKTDSCWLWSASTTRGVGGYGKMWHEGRLVGAHRLAFEHWTGQSAEGFDVMHSCDNTVCVNPEHLSIGTRHDNMRDAARKGRTTIGDRNPGAKLSLPEVAEIRYLLALGCRRRSIAKMYGVGEGAVAKILHRTRWSNVPNVLPCI